MTLMRPLATRSTVANCSANRMGSCMITRAAEMLMPIRSVDAATAAANVTGAGMKPSSVP